MTSGTVSRTKEHQRILVVDNDLDMLRFLNHALDIEGFDTVLVVDNDAAVDILQEIEPDLVIMDTVKPDEDTLRALDRMRAHSNVPIVLLTSDNELTTLKEAFDHGADDFIRKPFGTKLFIARIKAKLRRYQPVMRP
jgi:DNA-binding response OmpR family regulator